MNIDTESIIWAKDGQKKNNQRIWRNKATTSDQATILYNEFENFSFDFSAMYSSVQWV